MKRIAILLLSAALWFTPPAVLLVGTSGCTTSAKAVAYKTLAVTAATVDSALKAYADRLVSGKVDQATQIKVADAKRKYELGFKLAVDASQGDLTRLTPADVQALADQLTALINAIVK